MLRTMLLGEEGNFGEFKISNGYGMLAKACAEVQRGATVHLDVDMTMSSIATQDFKTWLDSQKHNFSDEQWHTLEENYAAGGFLGGILCGCFGMLFGAGDYNHYKNQHDKEVKVDDTKKEGFVKSLHDVTKTKVRVHGSLDIVGVSMEPTEACVYVELTTITFKDGTTHTVVSSSSPVALDSSGGTDRAEVKSGSLNIEPLPA